MRLIIFTIFIMIAMALAAPQGKKALSCSPKGGPCNTYSDCCRDLDCLFYAHKCVPRPGLPDPNDKRPIGPDY